MEEAWVNPDDKEIQGDRGISLRPLTPPEASALLKLIQNQGEDYLSWLNKEDLESFESEENILKGLANPLVHIYGIWFEGQLIGPIVLRKLAEDSTEAEIGYLIDKEHVSRRFATSAIKALSEHAFSDLGLETLIANVREDNRPGGMALRHADYHIADYDNRELKFVRKKDQLSPADRAQLFKKQAP